MVTWVGKDGCSYCGACGAACPRGCIYYSQDEEGFYYPDKDTSKCDNCGLCERVCPSLRPFERQEPLRAYACKHKEAEIRGASSSGGVFYALASYVIGNGGVVFGAAMDKDNRCVHTYVENPDGLRSLMGSKYVQSYLDGVFPAVKGFLEQGRTVLFTGTPCQVAGLKHYLRRDYDNLYCADLICHGVASPGVLEAYTIDAEKKYRLDVREIRFRHKNKGWNLVDSMVLSDRRGHTVQTRGDKYLTGFMGNYFLRLSCASCRANGYRSGADITLGDYWGGALVLKGFDDGQGVSAVIIRSEKGRGLFDGVSPALDALPAEIGHIARFNHNLEGSSKHSPKREAFFADYRKDKDFGRLAAKYIKPRLAGAAKRILGAKTVYRLFDLYKGRGGGGEA